MAYKFNPFTGSLDLEGDVLLTNTGTVSAPGDGTEDLPGIAFANDLDTGIYRPGNNQLAISTNGTERVEFGTSEVVFNDGGSNYDFRIEGDTNSSLFFVDASADAVGIGTTSPAVNLDTVIDSAVEWTSGANLSNTANLPFVGLSVNNTDTSITGTESSLLIQAGGSGTAIHSLTVKRTANNSGDLIFRRRVSTASAESMRIDNSGRLLIGTSSDQSESDSNGLIQVFTPTAAKLIIGREDSTVSTDDFIGIIDFRSTDGGSQRTARIAAQADGDHGTDDKPGRLVFSTTADGASSSTERMRIKSDGTINFSNVSVYADNTAAKAGGLVDGDVYRTSTGDLKIVYT